MNSKTETPPESGAPTAPAPHKLTWTEKLGYASGDVASCMYFSIFMNFLAYYYTDVFGISAAAFGTMIFAVRTYDWIKDPIMGVIADRTKSRMGKYRPWLLWMVVPYMIMGVLTFTTFDLSPTGKLVYAYTTYIVLLMVYTMINVPYSALMGVMTANSAERTTLSSFRFAGAAFANIVVSATLLYLVAFFGKGNDQRGFTLTLVVYALIAGRILPVHVLRDQGTRGTAPVPENLPAGRSPRLGEERAVVGDDLRQPADDYQHGGAQWGNDLLLQIPCRGREASLASVRRQFDRLDCGGVFHESFGAVLWGQEAGVFFTDVDLGGLVFRVLFLSSAKPAAHPGAPSSDELGGDAADAAVLVHDR